MTDLLPAASATIVVGFTVLPVIVATLVVVGLLRTSGARTASVGAGLFTLWLALTGGLATVGFFDAWAPPRMGLVVGTVLAVLAWSARAGWATRLGTLPINLLVGFEAFRIIVELLIHEAVVEGVAPPVLTWTGTNFDIIPASSALLLAPFAHRIPASLLQTWNVASALILVLTVATALLAMPMPFQQIESEPPNVWIATFPFIWLPAVLVMCAWMGHVVLFRRLSRRV